MIRCMFFLMLTKRKLKEIYLPLAGHFRSKVILIYPSHIFQVDICLTSTTRKKITAVGKNAHELRGMLLTILGFLLLHGKLEKLDVRIGGDRLSGFIKVMELTLLLEAWLNKDEFCEEDLLLFEKFLPYYIDLFTMIINRKEGCRYETDQSSSASTFHYNDQIVWLLQKL